MEQRKLVSYDKYIIRLASYITDYDRIVLTRLYQPLCGSSALAMYFTLLTEAKDRYLSDIATHQRLFEVMQCTIKEFEKDRKTLEALGLLKTYFSTTETKTSFYYYEIYAPLSADKFLSHVLYGTLLKQRLDAKTYKSTKDYFTMNNHIEGHKVDISVGFNDIFKINLDDTDSLKDVLSSDLVDLKKKTVKINSSFDIAIFKICLQNRQIKSEILNEELINTIDMMVSLYGLNEEEISDILQTCIHSNGLRQYVDLMKFKDKCYNNRRLIDNNLKMMSEYVEKQPKNRTKKEMWEEMSPYEFLQFRQNDIPPTQTDMNLIDEIKRQTSLPNPVINVLLDFVLLKKDNSLPKNYVLTIASDLLRSGIGDAIEASEYLKNKGKKIDNKQKELEKYSKDAFVEDNADTMQEIERLRQEYAAKRKEKNNE
ncbi:MAG: hypothetical protein E7184_02475 [Erysipelotrichaceae bacterium]|nr:hypothetical protein [Erysipelotrichaceae bacterium]